jgi:hypothetical protein
MSFPYVTKFEEIAVVANKLNNDEDSFLDRKFVAFRISMLGTGECGTEVALRGMESLKVHTTHHTPLHYTVLAVVSERYHSSWRIHVVLFCCDGCHDKCLRRVCRAMVCVMM